MKKKEIDDGHVHYVTVHLTEDCNLACSYCFSGKYRAPHAMNKQIAEDFARWFTGQTVEGSYSVAFFGGEPFMQPELMRFIIDKIRELRKVRTDFAFSATSNGTLIQPRYLKFLKEENISVMLSTDGDRDTHNRYRIYQNGRGSFDKFIEGAKLLQSVQPNVTARMTFTPDTVSALVKNHEALLFKYGFSAVAATPVTEACWNKNSLDIYERQLFKLASMLLEYWNKGKLLRIRILEKAVLELLENGPSDEIKYPCGAGRTAAGVGIDGRIYPCHRFVGMDQFVIGSIYGGIQPERRAVFWQEPVQDATHCFGKCEECNLQPLCRGECYQVCYETTGDIKAPPRSYYELKRRTISVASKLLKHALEEQPVLLEQMMGIPEGVVDSIWRGCLP